MKDTINDAKLNIKSINENQTLKENKQSNDKINLEKKLN